MFLKVTFENSKVKRSNSFEQKVRKPITKTELSKVMFSELHEKRLLKVSEYF